MIVIPLIRRFVEARGLAASVRKSSVLYLEPREMVRTEFKRIYVSAGAAPKSAPISPTMRAKGKNAVKMIPVAKFASKA
jgi:hypothetical protein